MRGIFLLLCMLCIIPCAFAQDSENADSSSFQCTVLYPENAEYSTVSVASDTVKFRLFYVDDVCSGFSYRFSQQENLLLVQRTTSPPDTCTADEQILYGVEGFIANVPKGKYLFDLQTGATDNDLTSIFREVVIVKK
ncbi:MAG: hypothetical protein JW913_06115 [Chitinispirillaceae bacterium]|nr:hypothetical protein [Chitinispirillaceae bacterium]